MYIFRYLREEGCYTVGHYSPDGKWHPESDHLTSEEAAERVNCLNGGQQAGNRLEARLARLERKLRNLEQLLPHIPEYDYRWD